MEDCILKQVMKLQQQYLLFLAILFLAFNFGQETTITSLREEVIQTSIWRTSHSPTTKKKFLFSESAYNIEIQLLKNFKDFSLL